MSRRHSEYSYQYDNSKRIQCPKCGSPRAFAPFYGFDDLGYCHKCGYFAHPGRDRRVTHTKVPRRSLNPFKQPPTLSAEEAQALLMPRVKASLAYVLNMEDALWLSAYARTMMGLVHFQTMKDWCIGLEGDGAVVYWYRDQDGYFVNGKVMRYEADGFHRSKARQPQILLPQRCGGNLPLFGLHQLGFPEDSCRDTTPIILVESEKTAIVSSKHLTGYIWLATGGAKGLTARKASPLRGREVFVCYDADEAGVEGGKSAVNVLTSVGAKAAALPMSVLFADQPKGSDLADTIAQCVKLTEEMLHDDGRANK